MCKVFLRISPLFNRSLILKIFICLSIITGIYEGTFASEHKHVLVIHSYHPTLAWTRDVIEGITTTFEDIYPDVEIQNEFMDTKRFKPETVTKNFISTLSRKLLLIKPDAVILSDDNALNFALDNRFTLFKGIPLVFCGINNYDERRISKYPDITGVVEYFDIKATIDAALNIHPNTKRIYVVNDNTTTGKENHAVLLRIMPDYAKGIYFDFIKSYSMNEVKSRLSKATPESFVLLMSFTRDSEGRVFTYRESIRAISSASRVPVYGVWGFYMGHGLTGGKLLRGNEQGMNAAVSCIRILRGEKASNIPVITRGLGIFMFDHRQLVKYKIRRHLLPEDSVIINKPETFYDRYKIYIILGFSLTIIVLGLFVFLVIQILKRWNMEKFLREREERLKFVIMGADLGTWDWNLGTGEATFNRRWATMLGYEHEEIEQHVSFWENHIYPEDLPNVESTLARHIRGETHMYEAEYRLVRKDGSVIWVMDRGKIIQRDRNGSAMRMTGTHLDITEKREYEEELQKTNKDLEQAYEHVQNTMEELAKTNKDLEQAYDSIQATMEELEATNEEFETQNIELVAVMDDLEKHRALLDSIFTAVPAGIAIVEMNRISWSNPMMSTMTGFANKDLKEADLNQIFPEFSKIDNIARTTPLNESAIIETRLKSRNNGFLEILVNLSVFEYLQSHVGYTIVILDITERKRSEELTYKQQKFQEALLLAMPLPVFYKDMEGKYLGCNNAFEDFFNISSEDIVGKRVEEIWGKKEAERFTDADKDLFEEKIKFQIYEYKLKDGRGRVREVIYFKTLFYDMMNKPAGVVGTFLDISERVEAQRQAENLRYYLKNIIDSMPAIIIGVDMKGCITQWNRRAEQHWKVSFKEARNMGLSAFITEFPIPLDLILKSINNREFMNEMKIPLMENEKITFWDMSVYPLAGRGNEGAVIRIDEVTERVRLEEMMIQAEKMFSIGGLAAGMAHEINNPLAGILQNVQVIRNRLTGVIPRNQEVAKHCGTTIASVEQYALERDIFSMIEAVEDSSNRAARIVRNMLNFSRKSGAESTLQNIPSLMDETIELVSNEYDLKRHYDFRKISIVRNYSDSPLLEKVPCEGSKMQQVFLNILKNGAQAMSEIRQPGYQPEFSISLLIENKMVVIKITDNGPGMSEEVRKRIFEPFFTTKQVGSGTGLGLSLSYFIVTENHRGKMLVESAPGKGTTFIIKLPLKRKASSAEL